MKLRLNASEQKINTVSQTLFCIHQSQKHLQAQKKQKFMNKLTMDYMLSQVKKQKTFGKLIPVTAKMYPACFNEGNKNANTHYSSMRVRRHKKHFQSFRYEANPEQNHQSIKKYTHFLSKKKQQQQGGIDSFWLFKKQITKDQVKKVKQNKNSNNEQQDDNCTDQIMNKTELAYQKLLIFGKIVPDINNSVIPKNVIKNFIASKFGQNFAIWFLNFYQLRSYITFKQFQQLSQRFKHIKLRESHVVSFYLYDQNGDGYICPRDVFSVFQRQLHPKIEIDVLKIAQFVKKNNSKEDYHNQEFKIQHVVIRDDWLTIKDYQIFFKKVDQPYLRATNKKDTVFSKTFAVLDHRQKIRSTRKQMNQKKSMYDQLYGMIKVSSRNHAFIDQDDYKLNYSFLYDIFGQNQTKLFNYFCQHLFNIPASK